GFQWTFFAHAHGFFVINFCFSSKTYFQSSALELFAPIQLFVVKEEMLGHKPYPFQILPPTSHGRTVAIPRFGRYMAVLTTVAIHRTDTVVAARQVIHWRITRVLYFVLVFVI